MYKQAIRALFLFVSFLVVSCEFFDIRDVSSDNLDTLRSDQQQVMDVNAYDNQLSSVRRYLGKRPSDVKLWNIEPLKSELHLILGKDYNSFVELMQNAVPLKEEKLIYTIGSHPNLSRIGFGYLIIDPDKNLLRVGMVKPGNHKTFGAKLNEVATPDEIERKCNSIL
jgi:hypothetical protein